MGSGNPNPVTYRDLLRRIWSFDPDDGTGVICARLQDLGMNSYTWDSTRRDEVVLVERGSEHCRKNLDDIIALKISFQILTNLFAEDNLASSSTVRVTYSNWWDVLYCILTIPALPFYPPPLRLNRKISKLLRPRLATVEGLTMCRGRLLTLSQFCDCTVHKHTTWKPKKKTIASLDQIKSNQNKKKPSSSTSISISIEFTLRSFSFSISQVSHLSQNKQTRIQLNSNHITINQVTKH